jgi:hypothetical protein
LQAGKILVDGNTARHGRNETFTAGSAVIAGSAGKATAGVIFAGQKSSQTGKILVDRNTKPQESSASTVSPVSCFWLRPCRGVLQS